MSRRGLPALLLVVVGLLGLFVVGRDTPQREDPFFAATGGTWMPAVGASGTLTGSWFCPGVPTDGAEGVGGAVVISNRDEAQIVGRYIVLTEQGVVADAAFTVSSWSQTTIDVDAFSSEEFASVVVEIEGGAGFVEQMAEHPLGNSVAACSNNTSAEWYVADGYTLEGSSETLILTNPFDEPVVAALRFSTEGRQSQPDLFRGFTVPPRSVRTIKIDELGRDEPIISVAIEATSGRLVVGRAQEYRGGGRFGYDVSLAAPELRDQWWFADGERSDGVTETYSIYNPTDEEVEVTVFFGGLALASSAVNEGDPVVVPPLRTVVFDPTESGTGDEGADVDGEADGESTADSEPTTDGDGFEDIFSTSTELPAGRHSTVFSTLAQPSIVVERVLTRQVEGTIATSTVLGAPPRADGFVPTVWHMGIGPTEPTQGALVVYNIDQVASAVTVSVVGPDGPSPVPSLTNVGLPSGSIITIDLIDPDVIGREVIVSANSRVFVERLLPRGNDLPGLVGSWLLPQSN
ncbi:MAG: DUF5719 family protein [Ilumatobacter sp.]